MSFNWRNSLRASLMKPSVMNKSSNSLDFEILSLPMHTKILNYEQNLKRLILNVFI